MKPRRDSKLSELISIHNEIISFLTDVIVPYCENNNINLDGINRIILSLKNNSKPEMLAEYNIAIAKLFDFEFHNDLISMYGNKLNNLIIKTVKISKEMILLGPCHELCFSCGSHEDAACVRGTRGGKYNNERLYKDWPTLLEKDAVNFCGDPFPEEIKDRKIFRIFSNKTSRCGSWWMFNDVDEKKNWRSEMAILNAWNTGQYIISVNINNVKAWVGKAASQSVINQTCFLKGGGSQIWIPYNVAKTIVSDAKLVEFSGIKNWIN